MANNTGNPVPSANVLDFQDNAQNLDSAVNSQESTWTDRFGNIRPTLASSLLQLGYAAPVSYESGIEFTTSDGFKTVDEDGVIYAPLPSALPFTTSGTWGGDDDARFFVVQGLKPSDLSLYTNYEFDTISDVISGTTIGGESVGIKVGDVCNLKGRTDTGVGGGVWDIQTDLTANGYDIVTVGSNLQAVLRVNSSFNVAQLGAVNGTNLTPLIERASEISDSIIINSLDGVLYNVIGSPTIPASFTSIMLRNNLNGAAPEAINGKILNAGISAGSLSAPGFGDKRLRIVAGTVRKKLAGGDKWEYINDVGHRTIGVNGAPSESLGELTAVGNVLSIPLPKTYELIGSVVVGPDERLARTLNASFGASVDNNQFSITGGCLYKASYLIYYDGASWQAEQKSSFGLGTVTPSYDGSGNLTISHDSYPGLDAVLTPSSNGGSTAPFMPCLKTVGSGSTAINFVDPSSGTLSLYNGAVSTAMSFIWSTEYKGQIILDGSSGSHVIDDQLVQGNIWFFGVFTDTLES